MVSKPIINKIIFLWFKNVKYYSHKVKFILHNV